MFSFLFQLKAFYVDLLVPLETNLEKDTKVVQSEQKRFLQQHKQRSETYSKAAAMMKKQRKKSRGSTKAGLAMDKELKNMQVLEEEKTKLDAFCEQSLKNAMTQERRRYGFVLERQCSLAKHYLSYHNHGVETYSQHIEKWSDVAKTREYLPESVENIFSSRIRQISVWQDDDLYSNPRSPNFEEDRMSLNSQLRKTKSMDASCLDVRSMTEGGSPVNTLSRAKSEFNLNVSNMQDNGHTPSRRPKSMAVPPPPSWDTQLARALYAYLSSGENQLSFHEGDLIALIGERNKGWQFGENLRTQCSGWFPLAYTEVLLDDTLGSPSHHSDVGTSNQQHPNGTATPTNHVSSGGSGGQVPSGSSTLEQPARMFGDTLHLNRANNATRQIRRAIGSNNIPPPAAPAPVPTPSLPYQKSGGTLPQSQSTNFGSSRGENGGAQYSAPGIKSSASTFNFSTGGPPGPYSTHPAPSRERPSAGSGLPLHLQSKGGKIGGPVGNVSLHSSNDSGFSNDPPPQPEIDYSDDESTAGQTKLPIRRSRRDISGDSNNNTLLAPKVPRHPRPKHKLSNSHGDLMENRYYASDSPDVSKVKVKRTKSFWKFGKNSSDDILEGMALWKHRDLVDLNEKPARHKVTSLQRTRRVSRDHSNDSDRTINNKDHGTVQEKQLKKPKTPKARQKLALKANKEAEAEDIYGETKASSKYVDQFYDDDGDGLMMRTVNRKNILQQYADDISQAESEFASDITSDDPYSIVVDDQKVRKNGNNYPNVAEIGKKLEKFSKTNKYSPTKNGEVQERSRSREKEVMEFKTFGLGNDEGSVKPNEEYYAESSKKDRKPKQSYESVDKEMNERNKMNGERKEQRSKYYDSTNDELSEVGDNRQFLPRTKLTKTNSKGSSYDQDVGLMEYGETLQRRLKNSEYNSKFDEKSPHNGNMYGPWYDLWGLDSSARK
ncbi:hypothetical protein GWI33_015537 [Rhynchophorus ferrugineus]|uniref:Brain-specific angiogenesis inhibitor 1-associated protein 2 n=1 Tax=Rhynchophorus ferrugineus TaxID=354439 RepID=A0A834I568_RHYFE|nr:hypothetical protein GWI33_015537 [Rhynchophorus ferrugineus]